jgi:hypothetical protein
MKARKARGLLGMMRSILEVAFVLCGLLLFAYVCRRLFWKSLSFKFPMSCGKNGTRSGCGSCGLIRLCCFLESQPKRDEMAGSVAAPAGTPAGTISGFEIKRLKNKGLGYKVEVTAPTTYLSASPLQHPSPASIEVT